MTRPLLLDLFCGAGGAAKGYHDAGFDVVGVDIEPQPRFPFRFLQKDAMQVLADLLCGWNVSELNAKDFSAIHCSPPCQRYSQMTPKDRRDDYPDLIAKCRTGLEIIGKPFVIENVPSAASLLMSPLMLCGSMFGLNLRRHRFFELGNWYTLGPAMCEHKPSPVLITGTHRRTYEPRYEYTVQQCRDAAGIDWMTRTEIDQAIPPAYTEYIGKRLIEHLAFEAV